MDHTNITTAFELPGYKVVQNLGIVRGITEAFELMVRHADELGANAMIGVRYDATEISSGVTEVLAYSTAEIVEPFRE